MGNENLNNIVSTKDKELDKKPNEHIGFMFSSSVKIFDPVTKEVLVQKRADD
jgi:hypothetical protein